MIETTHTPTPCQKCQSTNIHWQKNARGQVIWGICRDCGATVEIKEVLDWRKRIEDALSKMK